jgi:predicted esterase
MSRLRGIIATELQSIKPQNLIIRALSQSCGISLSVLLSLEYSVRGYIGMSGYLPYQSDLEMAIKDDEENPFEDVGATE